MPFGLNPSALPFQFFGKLTQSRSQVPFAPLSGVKMGHRSLARELAVRRAISPRLSQSK